MEWKWTKGEPYERSRRIFKNENYENGGNGENRENDEKFSKDIETSAYSSALNHDENTWDMCRRRWLRRPMSEEASESVCIKWKSSLIKACLEVGLAHTYSVRCAGLEITDEEPLGNR